MLAHGMAGVGHAVVISLIYGLADPAMMRTPLWIAPLVAFLVPALATVLYLARTRKALRALQMVLGLLGLALVSDGYVGLVALVFKLHVLVPVSLFLVSTHRYWRGIAPLMLVVTYVASLCWVASAELGRVVLGAESAAIWPLRLLGFAIGGWLGVRGVRELNRRYLEHRFGDQELFIDSFWLVHTLAQAIILVVVRESWWMLASLVAFPVYLVVKRAALRSARTHAPSHPTRLLLLRVFKKDVRGRLVAADRHVERLIDTLSDQWAFVGTVEMIGGADLALRNISPSDFIEFVSRTLKRRFIRGPEELNRRLTELGSVRADPDGRFRSEHFFCHDDTWQPVMRAMAAQADAVLVDLHGFGASRGGALYELLHLAVNEPNKPALLLYGDDAELDHLTNQFSKTEVRPGAEWLAAKADANRQIETEVLMNSLLQMTVGVCGSDDQASRKATPLGVPGEMRDVGAG
jgi:hypothetical protein